MDPIWGIYVHREKGGTLAVLTIFDTKPIFTASHPCPGRFLPSQAVRSSAVAHGTWDRWQLVLQHRRDDFGPKFLSTWKINSHMVVLS